MKRFRLSTLLLLVVIAALCFALVMQEMRHRRREADLQSQHAYHREKLAAKGLEWRNEYNILNSRYQALQREMNKQAQLKAVVEGVAGDGK